MNCVLATPKCFPPLSEQQKVKYSSMTSSTPLKSHPVYTQISSLEEEEILARVILAEALSTRFYLYSSCLNQPIMKFIAQGVLNRLYSVKNSTTLGQRFGSSLLEILFKKSQFNPAISPYSEFQDFLLCPMGASRFMRKKCQQKSVRGLSHQDYMSKKFLTRLYSKALTAAKTIRSKGWQPSGYTSFYYPKYKYSKKAQCRSYALPSWVKNGNPIEPFVAAGKPHRSSCFWAFK